MTIAVRCRWRLRHFGEPRIDLRWLDLVGGHVVELRSQFVDPNLHTAEVAMILLAVDQDVIAENLEPKPTACFPAS